MKNSKHPNLVKCLAAFFFVCLIVYVYALFIPGIRYNGVFLYDKGGGVYKGSGSGINYSMTISKENNLTKLVFRANEKEKTYTAETGGSSVKIFCDGEKMFFGTAQKIGDSYFLTDENGTPDIPIRVFVGNVPSDDVDIFPFASEVFLIAQKTHPDTRGEWVFLVPILILIAILALDIRFPLLFFKLKYGLAVDGGEPSDLYYTMRSIGQAAAALSILVLAVLSFKL